MDRPFHNRRDRGTDAGTAESVSDGGRRRRRTSDGTSEASTARRASHCQPAHHGGCRTYAPSVAEVRGTRTLRAPITDGFLLELAGKTTLKRITLVHTNCSADGVRQFLKYRPSVAFTG